MQPRGLADERFGRVADAFARNFDDFPELGAAVAVYVDGRKVVDLSGGIADEATGRAWTSETVVPVFSCAKALVSLSIHLLAQDGRLDLDAPVAAYWPEFGKESITSRMVLGHRAGLPVLDRTLSFDEIAAWTPVVHAIEEQEPLWEPGTTYEYHGHVFGFLLGEVTRRITGLTPGQYFRKAIGEPLGLRAWIGLPTDELDDRARLVEAEGRSAMPGPEHLLTRIVTMNGALAFPGLNEPHGWNDPDLLTIELPGAGAVASAAGLAGLFAAAVTGIDEGEEVAQAVGAAVRAVGECGVRERLLSPTTLTDALTEVSSGKGYLGFDVGARWGSGFLLDSPFRPMLGARSFGNDGAGGQFAFGDDEHGVAFAYVSNRMIGHGDARASNLVTAVRDCL